MNEILIMDAFEEITKQLDANNLDLANKMLRIVTCKIDENKKKNSISEYIELSGKKEIELFNNLLEKNKL